MVDKYLITTGIALVPIFAIWLAATLGVLLGTESLSAFLHSMRLHWIGNSTTSFIRRMPLDYTELLKAAAKEREFDDNEYR